MVKTCTGCHKELASTKENFNLSTGGKFGLNSKCKNCKSEYIKKYYQENKINSPENKIKIAQERKKYRLENKKKIDKYRKKYRLENKKAASKYQKKYVEKLNIPYLKSLLKQQGFSSEQLTPEIIELKLILIKTKRL